MIHDLIVSTTSIHWGGPGEGKGGPPTKRRVGKRYLHPAYHTAPYNM